MMILAANEEVPISQPKEFSIKGGPYNTNNSNPMGENILNI